MLYKQKIFSKECHYCFYKENSPFYENFSLYDEYLFALKVGEITKKKYFFLTRFSYKNKFLFYNYKNLPSHQHTVTETMMSSERDAMILSTNFFYSSNIEENYHKIFCFLND